MSDAVAGLLFELYETNRATAYSNLLVGIVFGEQLLRSGLEPTCLVNGASPPHSFFPLGFLIFPGAYVVLYGTSLYILM